MHAALTCRHASAFVDSAALPRSLGFGRQGLLLVHGGITVRSVWASGLPSTGHAHLPPSPRTRTCPAGHEACMPAWRRVQTLRHESDHEV